MTSDAANRFLPRAVVASAAAAGFAALAWADATGFAGVPAGWWLMPIALAVAVGGVDELVRLFAAGGVVLPGRLLQGGAAAVVLSAAMPPRSSPAWAAVAFTAVLIAVLLHAVATYRPDGRSLERLAAGTLVAAYVGLPMAFVVLMRYVDGDRMLPLASLVAAVKGGDIAAYVVGSLVGRRKMAPNLSPGKTWEGAAASLAASVGIAWWLLDRWRAGDGPGPVGGWPVYGLAVGLSGMAGDLAESLLKRELHAKDSGRSLAALGGVLDLADSLLLAAPIAWFLWALGPLLPA